MPPRGRGFPPNAAVILLRLPRLTAFTVLCAGAIAGALLTSGCGSSASPARPLSRPPLISIFESGPQLRADPAATLDTLHRLGVGVVKVFVPWEEVAPDAASPVPPKGFAAADPAAYPAASWAPFDAIVRDAAARGIAVDLTVNAPPLWAAGPGAPQPGPDPQWKPSARALGKFMRALGTRYSGSYTPPGASAPLPRVNFWSIWNEPNYGPDLAPQAIDNSTVEVSPALYRGLLDASWSALQATGHGRDTILIGELAPRGQSGGGHPGNFDGMVPLRFLRALYCVDGSLAPLRGAAATARQCPPTAAGSSAFRARHPALFEATGVADHPYGQGMVPPNVVTPDEPDFADLPAIPKLESTLDQLQAAYGSHRHLPIYSTEFGYPTNPPERLAAASTPTRAALYLNWAEYISWRDPRIASYDQYQLIDPARTKDTFATGLEFANGTPKATYAAYRMPLFLPVSTGARGHQLEVWGSVRPAHSLSAPQPVQIQFRPATGGGFKPVRSVALIDRYGYFDVMQAFPGSGTVRLSWSYPDGQTIHSRDVIVTLR